MITQLAADVCETRLLVDAICMQICHVDGICHADAMNIDEAI